MADAHSQLRNKNRFQNKKEAADYLGVSTRAIERYTKQGKLEREV